MAISVFKTFSAGEVLTASDLNSSLTQITDNGEDLGWPATKAKDLDGFELILDADADTSITADTDDQIDFKLAGTDQIIFAGVATNETVFNETQLDIDFRVEGNSDANLLMLDASTDRVGIGVAAPGFKLDVDAGTATTIANLVSTSDGADAALTLLNDAGSGSTDETVSLIAQHVDANGPGGKIVFKRIADYSSAANEDGAIEFYTPLNGTDTLALTLDQNQDATFAGDITVDLTATVTGNLAVGQAQSGNALNVLEADAVATFVFDNSNASPFGGIIDFSTASPDDNTNYFLWCLDSTADRCFIYSDGDLQNADNAYGGISDETLKQDIIDAPSQWDDIKNIRVRKFRFKTDLEQYGEDAPYLLGTIAQEVQKVSPGLVRENGDDLLGMKYSILYMKAVGALQENMQRTETLEDRVGALEARI